VDRCLGLEHDVLDACPAEVPADRKACLACPDDGDRDVGAHDFSSAGCIAATRTIAVGANRAAVSAICSVVDAADVQAKPNLARTRSLASASAVPDRSRNSATE
jgi:hypothetical protein